jgi:general stress protein 26
MSKQSSVDRIWDIIENVGVCMLATQRAGRLRARPMEPRPDRKHRLIFAVTDSHSAKLDEIEATSDIDLIFIDAKAKAYLSITGRALESDRDEAWWPGGPPIPMCSCCGSSL